MTKNMNSIDVSRCKHYDIDNNYCDQSYLGEGGLLKNTKNPKKCEQSPNCYYKQLKRLEQENKELKEKIKSEKYIKENALQEATKYSMKCGEFRQALEEIKKWTTNHNPCDIEADINCTKEDCFECLNYDIKKITEIINEALNDRD